MQYNQSGHSEQHKTVKKPRIRERQWYMAYYKFCSSEVLFWGTLRAPYLTCSAPDKRTNNIRTEAVNDNACEPIIGCLLGGIA